MGNITLMAMTTKLDFYQRKLPSQANQLRDQLQFVEDSVINLSRRDRAYILDFFGKMDAIQTALQTMAADHGPDMSPETLRFGTVKNRFLAQASGLLAKIGGSSALQKVRPGGVDQENQPWWYIDRLVASQQSNQLKQVGTVVGAVIGFLLLAYILLNTIFKPDPAVVARANYTDQAMAALIEQQDYPLALENADGILAISPDDLEGLVLKGVALEKLDRAAEAEQYFSQADAAAAAPEQVPLVRGRLQLQLGDAQQALTLAEQSIEANPSYAEGWFLAGQAYDQLGNFQQALSHMNTAADLALEQDNPSLYAIIKVNVGYLSPRAPAPAATTESN
jgi:tetratricopeptide (TPR) repeat protein